MTMMSIARSDIPSVWGLIPARGGSKGIPRKNMVLLRGRPLIDYTIEAALASASIDVVAVSSDDSEILEFARSRGVRSILRPAVHASDAAPAEAVVRHFLSTLAPLELAVDPTIVYLQPTSPLRSGRDIEDAFAAMKAAHADSLVSVMPSPLSPFKMFTLSSNGLMQSLFDERMSNMRRQDLPQTFIPNGAIYIFRASHFTARDGFPSNGSLAFLMDPSHSVDIDGPADLESAASLLERHHA